MADWLGFAAATADAASPGGHHPVTCGNPAATAVAAAAAAAATATFTAAPAPSAAATARVAAAVAAGHLPPAVRAVAPNDAMGVGVAAAPARHAAARRRVDRRPAVCPLWGARAPDNRGRRR